VFSVVVKSAKVVDGSGNPWYRADVAIDGERIAAVGDLGRARADLVLDGAGLVVAPGFIDIHTHSDLPLLIDGEGQAHIQQGVTTNVLGNCGGSTAPVTEESVGHMSRQLAEIDEDMCWDWRSMGQYLDRLERQGVSVNVAPLVGQGTVRGAVMGYADRPPTADELARMCELVRGAMADGAFGLSSGLIYVPGSYARTDEIVALARVAAEWGGIYASHIRGENDTLLAAVAEAIDIGRQAGLPVQIAHFKAMGRHMWGKSVDSLRMVDEARAAGLDVTCDQYPYNASATGLGAYLPAWVHVGGPDAMRERLSSPEIRAHVRHDILHGTEGWVSLHKGVGWDNTLITRCNDTAIEGLTVSEIAKRRGVDEFDAAFDLLIENQGRVSVVYFTIGDEDIERIMRHPAVMIGSDSSAIAAEGVLARGKPHPRTFGTFVRVLGEYARERQTITLEEAVRKMTSLPAQRLGLHDRGLLRPGMKADVVLFDPDTVADRATYTEPMQYPVGIAHVLVNGRLSVTGGRHLGERAGAVLRRGRL
jgi:N-acyl-D-amino-acid deacylase